MLFLIAVTNLWTSVFSISSVPSFHVVCAPSVREMKHVCPFNVSNIELYLYIIYMLISFLYPYRPTSMCYTQVLYSNIYIAFFLWEKKNNKMQKSKKKKKKKVLLGFGLGKKFFVPCG